MTSSNIARIIRAILDRHYRFQWCALPRSFAISHYPAFYLVDRQGKLRVAQPHRLGMERAIRHYLEP